MAVRGRCQYGFGEDVRIGRVINFSENGIYPLGITRIFNKKPARRFFQNKADKKPRDHRAVVVHEFLRKESRRVIDSAVVIRTGKSQNTGRRIVQPLVQRFVDAVAEPAHLGIAHDQVDVCEGRSLFVGVYQVMSVARLYQNGVALIHDIIAAVYVVAAHAVRDDKVFPMVMVVQVGAFGIVPLHVGNHVFPLRCKIEIVA